MKKILRLSALLPAIMLPGLHFAQDANLADAVTTTTEALEEVVSIDTGNTAWMLTATVLVLFMTLPALTLFYGGLVRSQNVLSVLMHC